jgi:hypothetical protein
MAFRADKGNKTISVDIKIEDQAAMLLQQSAEIGLTTQYNAYKAD